MSSSSDHKYYIRNILTFNVKRIIIEIKTQEKGIHDVIGEIFKETLFTVTVIIYNIISALIPFFFFTYTPIIIWLCFGLGLVIFPAWILKIIGFSIVSVFVFGLIIWLSNYIRKNISPDSKPQENLTSIKTSTSDPSDKASEKVGFVKRIINNIKLYIRKISDIINLTKSLEKGGVFYNFIILPLSYIFLAVIYSDVSKNTVFHNILFSLFDSSWRFFIMEPVMILLNSLVFLYNEVILYILNFGNAGKVILSFTLIVLIALILSNYKKLARIIHQGA